MTTLLYTHPACLEHDPGNHHPESPARLRAVLAALSGPQFAGLERREAPEAAIDDLAAGASAPPCRARPGAVPRAGHVAIDADTVLSPASGRAALARRRGGHRRGRRGRRREGRQRLLRGAPARASRRARPGDGLLPVQQRRDRRAAGARGARPRPGGGRRFRRPSRQRHAGRVRGRRQPVLRLDPSIPALSRHRRRERDRGRQHRQRAVAPDVGIGAVSPAR